MDEECSKILHIKLKQIIGIGQLPIYKLCKLKCRKLSASGASHPDPLTRLPCTPLRGLPPIMFAIRALM